MTSQSPAQDMGEINILEYIGHFIIVEFKTTTILQIYVCITTVKYFLKVWIRNYNNIENVIKLN